MNNSPVLPGEKGPRMKRLRIIEAVGFAFAIAVMGAALGGKNPISGVIMSTLIWSPILYSFNANTVERLLMDNGCRSFSEQEAKTFLYGVRTAVLVSLAFKCIRVIFTSFS